MSEPRRRGLGRWKRLATPYVAIAALAFVASLGFYLAGHGPGVGRPAAVDLRPPQVEVANANQEVRLVLVDQSGLARPDFVTLDLPSDPAARLAVVLDALHAAMMKAGSWPLISAFQLLLLKRL